MMEVHGTCSHCGQYVLVRVNEDATQEEINEAATLECGCSESKKDKEKQEDIRKCKTTIEKIFGDTRVAELLTEAADDIREGTIMQMTLKLTKSMRTIRKAIKLAADIIAAVSILGMVLIGIALADGARREDFRIGGRDV